MASIKLFSSDHLLMNSFACFSPLLRLKLAFLQENIGILQAKKRLYTCLSPKSSVHLETSRGNRLSDYIKLISRQFETEKCQKFEWDDHLLSSKFKFYPNFGLNPGSILQSTGWYPQELWHTVAF